MHLAFRSDGSVSYTGFHLEYKGEGAPGGIGKTAILQLKRRSFFCIWFVFIHFFISELRFVFVRSRARSFGCVFFLFSSARSLWLRTQSIMGVVDVRCHTPRGANVSEICPSGFKHLLNDSVATLKRAVYAQLPRGMFALLPCYLTLSLTS